MKKSSRNLLFVGLVVLIVALVGTGTIPLSGLLPGYEGEQNGLYGYQPNSASVSSLGAPLQTPPGSCGYSWDSSPTISAASINAKTAETFLGILQPCALGTTLDTMDLGAQTNPVLTTSPYATPDKVNYYLKVPGSSNRVEYVTGQVNEYTFNLNLAIDPTSSGGWNFAGDTVWYNLAAVDWNRAFPDPNNSSVTGPVFESPLYGVVTNVQWNNRGASQCSLCTIGAPLDFYSSPSTTGQTLVTLTDNTAPTSDLNASISSLYSPDSRMQSLVYYPLTVTHMVNNCNLGTCQAPQVSITITLYTLQLGVYILTNPSTTSLQIPGGACSGYFCGFYGDLASLQSFFTNPFSDLGASIYLLIVIAVVVFIVVEVILKRVPSVKNV